MATLKRTPSPPPSPPTPQATFRDHEISIGADSCRVGGCSLIDSCLRFWAGPKLLPAAHVGASESAGEAGRGARELLRPEGISSLLLGGVLLGPAFRKKSGLLLVLSQESVENTVSCKQHE